MTTRFPRVLALVLTALAVASLVAAASFATGCGGRVPATRYYDLAAPAGPAGTGAAVLVLEPLTTDEAYDDERIVYRANEYRLDYYDYHRWSSPPGVLVGNYLEAALERSGHFRAVVREPAADATAVLTGRVAAIEEIDVSRKQWEGRLVVELRLTDSRTGATLWSQQFEEREPLARQSPEGLAAALTRAMERIVAAAAPQIAAHARPSAPDADEAAAADPRTR